MATLTGVIKSCERYSYHIVCEDAPERYLKHHHLTGYQFDKDAPRYIGAVVELEYRTSSRGGCISGLWHAKRKEN